MTIKNVSRIIIIALALLQAVYLPAWGREGGVNEHVLGFAESLYDEGDYFRAIGEYKRFIFLHPGDLLAERAHFRIAESFFQAKRWQEAIDAGQLFLTKYPASLRYFEMLYLKGRVERQDRRYADALLTFDAIVTARELDYGDKARYQKALIRLEQRDWQGAKESLLQFPPGSPLSFTATAFAAEIPNREDLPRKSPVTAGLLAALLPGAGHLYAERPRDALMAFLLNGAFIWGAVELFRQDNYAAGGIVAFFEAGWYSGNIYSAVSSVHKYNRDIEDNLIQKLKDKFSVSFRQERGAPAIMIGKIFP